MPLIVEEPATDLVRSWLQQDPEILLWGLSRLEIASAIERRFREGNLRASERATALARAERLANDAHEVTDLAAVRVRGLPLLARHALRAADAAQLAAALLIADPDPTASTMVVLDRRLAHAALREGLRVLSWPE